MSGNLREAQISNHLKELSELIGEYEENLILEDDPRSKRRFYKALEDLKKQQEAYRQELKGISAGSVNSIQEESASEVDEALESDVKLQELFEVLRDLVNVLHSSGFSSKEWSVEEAVEVYNEPRLDFKHALEYSVPIIPFFLSYKGEAASVAELNISSGLEKLKRLLRTDIRSLFQRQSLVAAQQDGKAIRESYCREYEQKKEQRKEQWLDEQAEWNQKLDLP